MIALPSRSGRIASSSSCSRSRAIRSSRSSYVPRQRRRLAPVAGRAVRPGQLVQPVQQRTGVGDVPAYGGVGPLPGAVAVEPQVQLDQPATRPRPRPWGTAAPAAGLRVSFAPTTSWWWNETPPPGSKRRVFGLPTSCMQRGQPQHEVRRRSAPPARSPARARSGCARRRPCAGGARRSPAPAAAARAARGRPARCRPAARGPARGSGASSSLTSSSRTRSADTISIRSAIAVIAASTAGSTAKPELRGEPGRPHHPQRVVAERVLRRGPASAAARRPRSSSPPYGSTNARRRQRRPPSR